MGCIRVDKITEYLCEPLRKCLKDEDPYVRKTAAVCVAKLYDISSGITLIFALVTLVNICGFNRRFGGGSRLFGTAERVVE